MTKITALIIALNEEKNIGACIDSLSSVADEVLVIDSHSADRTQEIAGAKGVRIIIRDFAGFGQQKNAGAADASHDLILSIDADEVLSDDLKTSILAVKSNPMAAAYCFNRLNHIGKRSIRTCGWYPDTSTRLYDRGLAKWSERKVHEELIVDGETKFLTGDLLHYTYQDLGQMKKKTTRYAGLGAEIYKGGNAVTLIFKMIFSGTFKFFKSYILQRGFTDGYVGLMISWYGARETFLKYYQALT